MSEQIERMVTEALTATDSPESVDSTGRDMRAGPWFDVAVGLRRDPTAPSPEGQDERKALAEAQGEVERLTASLESRVKECIGLKRHISELTTRLASQAEPSDWQLIESAPKDGTAIMLFGAQYGYSAWMRGYYFNSSADGSEGWITTIICTAPNDDWRGCGPTPTHWMPLPAPPGGRPTGSRQDERERLAFEAGMRWSQPWSVSFKQESADRGFAFYQERAKGARALASPPPSSDTPWCPACSTETRHVARGLLCPRCEVVFVGDGPIRQRTAKDATAEELAPLPSSEIAPSPDWPERACRAIEEAITSEEGLDGSRGAALLREVNYWPRRQQGEERKPFKNDHHARMD